MDNSGPAFPNGGNLTRFAEPGLTKRELAAMFAMAGLLANPNKDYAPDGCAIDSLCYADALLAALKEEAK